MKIEIDDLSYDDGKFICELMFREYTYQSKVGVTCFADKIHVLYDFCISVKHSKTKAMKDLSKVFRASCAYDMMYTKGAEFPTMLSDAKLNISSSFYIDFIDLTTKLDHHQSLVNFSKKISEVLILLSNPIAQLRFEKHLKMLSETPSKRGESELS